MCAPYRADSSRVVLFDIGTKDSIAGISPAFQGWLSFIWLHVAHLFPKVVEAEGHTVAGVQEASLTQVAMLCNQDLLRREIKY